MLPMLAEPGSPSRRDAREVPSGVVEAASLDSDQVTKALASTDAEGEDHAQERILLPLQNAALHVSRALFLEKPITPTPSIPAEPRANRTPHISASTSQPSVLSAPFRLDVLDNLLLATKQRDVASGSNNEQFAQTAACSLASLGRKSEASSCSRDAGYTDLATSPRQANEAHHLAALGSILDRTSSLNQATWSTSHVLESTPTLSTTQSFLWTSKPLPLGPAILDGARSTVDHQAAPSVAKPLAALGSPPCAGHIHHSVSQTDNQLSELQQYRSVPPCTSSGPSVPQIGNREQSATRSLRTDSCTTLQSMLPPKPVTAVEALARLPEHPCRNASGDGYPGPHSGPASLGTSMTNQGVRQARIEIKPPIADHRAQPNGNDEHQTSHSSEDETHELHSIEKRKCQQPAPTSEDDSGAESGKAAPSIRISSVAPRSFFPVADEAAGVTADDATNPDGPSETQINSRTHLPATQPPLPAFDMRALPFSSSDHAPSYAGSLSHQPGFRSLQAPQWLCGSMQCSVRNDNRNHHCFGCGAPKPIVPSQVAPSRGSIHTIPPMSLGVPPMQTYHASSNLSGQLQARPAVSLPTRSFSDNYGMPTQSNVQAGHAPSPWTTPLVNMPGQMPPGHHAFNASTSVAPALNRQLPPVAGGGLRLGELLPSNPYAGSAGPPLTRSHPSDDGPSHLAWAQSNPSTSFATAARLASMGVRVGPGVNPHVRQDDQGQNGTSSQPPIVNTGNLGPMCVQPGDWVCSTCAFVNWRRRRVCMRCFPFAAGNEVSASLANGAIIAAQLAAGIEPSPDTIASLAANCRPQTQPKTSNSRPESLVSGALALPSTLASTPVSSNPKLAPFAALDASLPQAPRTAASPQSLTDAMQGLKITPSPASGTISMPNTATAPSFGFSLSPNPPLTPSVITSSGSPADRSNTWSPLPARQGSSQSISINDVGLDAASSEMDPPDSCPYVPDPKWRCRNIDPIGTRPGGSYKPREAAYDAGGHTSVDAEEASPNDSFASSRTRASVRPFDYESGIDALSFSPAPAPPQNGDKLRAAVGAK